MKLDLTFKSDETKKLQIDLHGFSDTRTKCNKLEEKLSLEIRNSQFLQNKILQLEQELMNITKNSNKQEDLVANKFVFIKIVVFLIFIFKTIVFEK